MYSPAGWQMVPAGYQKVELVPDRVLLQKSPRDY